MNCSSIEYSDFLNILNFFGKRNFYDFKNNSRYFHFHIGKYKKEEKRNHT